MTGKAGRRLVPALRTDFLDSLAASLELPTTPRGEPLAAVVVASICHRTLPPGAAAHEYDVESWGQSFE